MDIFTKIETLQNRIITLIIESINDLMIFLREGVTPSERRYWAQDRMNWEEKQRRLDEQDKQWDEYFSTLHQDNTPSPEAKKLYRSYITKYHVDAHRGKPYVHALAELMVQANENKHNARILRSLHDQAAELVEQ